MCFSIKKEKERERHGVMDRKTQRQREKRENE